MATSMGDSIITPDLLQKIEYEDSKRNKQTINLYTVLANEWIMVCDLIGFSIPEKRLIAKKFPTDPKMCIQEVIEAWILEKDKYKRYPCTWNGICKLLNDIKMSTISNQLVEALKATKSSFGTDVGAVGNDPNVEADSASANEAGTDISAVGNDPNVQADGGSANEAEGEKIVGKITYCSNDLLGRGNNGTLVFQGKFDKCPVAVKRLQLLVGSDFADREAELLQLSDGHANVVRYYIMEQDDNFKYIALELGQGTLEDYVNDRSKFTGCEVNCVDLLEQAMKGLAYLHSIDIVHRDIKPHNVLLSFPSPSGSVTAMISDFGHCRKLPDGKVSFTSSKLTGTLGWAAPEVLDDSKRLTFAVDIFSMGCVIYYVLTSGHHPFDPLLQRQAKIGKDEYDLSDLSEIDKYTASDLLKNMISHNSNSRPTAKKVLCHCLFWSEKKQLEFFQDVSDYIEGHVNSPVCQSLEWNSSRVCGEDWMNNISDELKEDLRKHRKRRSYQGSSVRDLLRVIRNKKHHYEELSEELKLSLGRIPDKYVCYFTSRFPQLLIYTYKSMETCTNEHIAKTYYSVDFSE